MPPDEPIRLSAYDPSWPARFEEERVALEEAIGNWVLGGVHHIGSTAVPGLEAKPIIDILAGVRDLDQSRACFEPLATLGYMYAPYLPEEMHWFCKPRPSRRTHHLHLVPVDSRRSRNELALRDRLRADPNLPAEYLALKRDLARRFVHDREAYTDAKSSVHPPCPWASIGRIATVSEQDSPEDWAGAPFPCLYRVESGRIRFCGAPASSIKIGSRKPKARPTPPSPERMASRRFSQLSYSRAERDSSLGRGGVSLYPILTWG